MTRKVRNAEAGITLIEVLVVLAVIGVAAGATMLGMSNRSSSAETEAIRLARHLMLGIDEALITGLPLVLQGDERGYRFGQLGALQSPDSPTDGPEDWPASAIAALGSRHDLPRPLELRLRDGAADFAVVLPVSGAAPTVAFQFAGAPPVWTVIFDGFTAVAQAEGGA